MSSDNSFSLSVPDLIQEIRRTTTALNGGGPSDGIGGKSEEVSENDRQKLFDASTKLVSALEGPTSTSWKIVQASAWHAALRTAYKMNLFDAIPRGQKPITAEALGSQIGADPTLVARIMRALTCLGVCDEVEDNEYQHNLLSMHLGNPLLRTIFTGMLDVATPVMPSLPDFLSSIDYQNPTERDITSLLAQSSHYSDDHADLVLFVDFGGGRGQILADVRSEQANLKGRMIIQDLQGVLGDWKSPGNVEVMAYDFFNPQPIQGAYFYFFRHIFHDWPDVECRKILLNTIPALVPNKSRIIIVDAVMSRERQPHYSYCALLDMQMMALGGMERSEKQWRQLIESVGLKIMGIDHPPLRGKPGARTNDSIIEVMLTKDE
ncbi:hypothetical protein ABVK25_012312 [Lepraria finkii]|uniref:Uncharacterized protein n=1 Tax=Lepraria finkii TaxID=1340010 RepID=A0ABR4AFL8_9LECA